VVTTFTLTSTICQPGGALVASEQHPYIFWPGSYRAWVCAPAFSEVSSHDAPDYESFVSNINGEIELKLRY